LPVGRLASSGRRPWSRRSRSTKVSLEMSLKVSVTPRPAEATASTKGKEERPSASCIASIVRMSFKSRLLYWMTTGIPSNATPFDFRLSFRFCQLSRFFGSIVHCESATNTTPSEPFKTTRLVSLKAVCPGTVASWKRIL
jgi:hypothetical protein